MKTNTKNLIIIVVIVGGAILCLLGIVVFWALIEWAGNLPRAEIIRKQGDYLSNTFTVKATIKNSGGSGTVTVYCEARTWASNQFYEKQNQQIYLSTGEEKNVTFIFQNAPLGTRYNIWVT